MNKLVASIAALSLSASVAFAGGPVVVVEEGQPEVVQQQGSVAQILSGIHVVNPV